MSGSFFDSNTLIYLASGDREKARCIEGLIDFGDVISVQVLNESANVLRRKQGKSWTEIARFLDELCVGLVVFPLTIDIHHNGLRLAERYGFAIYDSFIVAAALAADCDTLWSEDMQHGMVVDGRLAINNPFSAPAAS